MLSFCLNYRIFLFVLIALMVFLQANDFFLYFLKMLENQRVFLTFTGDIEVGYWPETVLIKGALL